MTAYGSEPPDASAAPRIRNHVSGTRVAASRTIIIASGPAPACNRSGRSLGAEDRLEDVGRAGGHLRLQCSHPRRPRRPSLLRVGLPHDRLATARDAYTRSPPGDRPRLHGGGAMKSFPFRRSIGKRRSGTPPITRGKAPPTGRAGLTEAARSVGSGWRVFVGLVVAGTFRSVPAKRRRCACCAAAPAADDHAEHGQAREEAEDREDCGGRGKQ